MKKNKISTRFATEGDLPILYTFEQGIIATERPYDPTLKPDPITYYDIRKMITDEDVEVFIAEIDNEIIASGYIRILPSKPHFKESNYAYLGFMYVKPEYRGKGVNGLIIEEMKIWASNNGLSELRLQVYNENHSAIKAYEKVGFNKHMLEMRMEINILNKR
jgi:GNAT superfamily N-acetyltransferase